jgi:hypothetical protein
MSSNTFQYDEIVLFNPDKQNFTGVAIRADRRGFRLNYDVGIQNFFGVVDVVCDASEKSIISATILPGSKVIAVVVECYDVPKEKFVQYMVSGHELVRSGGTGSGSCNDIPFGTMCIMAVPDRK